MPRLIGVDIPNNKKLPYALRYIYGVGPCRASLIVEQTGLSPDMRAQDLTEENINKITAVIIENG
jgi:small subunit ribosomal protein S13